MSRGQVLSALIFLSKLIIIFIGTCIKLEHNFVVNLTASFKLRCWTNAKQFDLTTTFLILLPFLVPQTSDNLVMSVHG